MPETSALCAFPLLKLGRGTTLKDTLWKVGYDASTASPIGTLGVVAITGDFVTVDNFDDAVAADLVASEEDLTDPDNPIILKKRRRHIV